jgi:hypothetical protein
MVKISVGVIIRTIETVIPPTVADIAGCFPTEAALEDTDRTPATVIVASAVSVELHFTELAGIDCWLPSE